MHLNANSHSLLLFQADCFVRGLTLRSNTVMENLCMRPNIGPAAAGPIPVRHSGGPPFRRSTRVNPNPTLTLTVTLP